MPLNVPKRLRGRIQGVHVYMVDGSEIRKSVTLEEAWRGPENCMADFLDFGVHDNLREHGGFKQVPKNEVWVAEELKPKERALITKVAVHRWRLLLRGVKSAEAFRLNEEYNKGLRVEMYGNLENKEPRLERLFKTDAMQVWLVNGEIVRGRYNQRFIQGGHHLVYDFIPDNEIWVDDTLDPDEYKPVMVHEATEHRLMVEEGAEYAEAHGAATIAEYKQIRKSTNTIACKDC